LQAAALPVVFACGAVLGTAWDRLHVAAGTLGYPGARLGQPWWVPVEFGLAFTVVIVAVVRLGDPAPGPQTPRHAAAELAWFTAVYVVTAAAWRVPVVCGLALIGLLVLRLPGWVSVVRANAWPATGLMLGGPLIEAWLVAAGLFRYARTSTIPVWLPLLYAHGVPLALRGAELAVRLGGVRRPRNQAGPE
jgi:hypothetical protein